jgi:hypothetical protein
MKFFFSILLTGTDTIQFSFKFLRLPYIFYRISGDTINHAKSTMFAWEAARKGLDVHMLAEPTKLEALKSEFETKKGEFKSQMDKSILEKYGGQEHLEAPPRYGTVQYRGGD